MKVIRFIERVEIALGPQSENYIISLIEDGIREMGMEGAGITNSYTSNIAQFTSGSYERYYTMPGIYNIINIKDVYMKDSKGEYTRLPMIMNPEELIVEDFT